MPSEHVAQSMSLVAPRRASQSPSGTGWPNASKMSGFEMLAAESCVCWAVEKKENDTEVMRAVVPCETFIWAKQNIGFVLF